MQAIGLQAIGLQKIDENVWVAEQPIRYFGLSIRTRMTVLRLADRELAVISPIRIDEVLAGELDCLGDDRPYHSPQSLPLFFRRRLQSPLSRLQPFGQRQD